MGHTQSEEPLKETELFLMQVCGIQWEGDFLLLADDDQGDYVAKNVEASRDWK